MNIQKTLKNKIKKLNIDDIINNLSSYQELKKIGFCDKKIKRYAAQTQKDIQEQVLMILKNIPKYTRRKTIFLKISFEANNILFNNAEILDVYFLREIDMPPRLWNSQTILLFDFINELIYKISNKLTAL